MVIILMCVLCKMCNDVIKLHQKAFGSAKRKRAFECKIQRILLNMIMRKCGRSFAWSLCFRVHVARFEIIIIGSDKFQRIKLIDEHLQLCHLKYAVVSTVNAFDPNDDVRQNQRHCRRRHRNIHFHSVFFYF